MYTFFMFIILFHLTPLCLYLSLAISLFCLSPFYLYTSRYISITPIHAQTHDLTILFIYSPFFLITRLIDIDTIREYSYTYFVSGIIHLRWNFEYY